MSGFSKSYHLNAIITEIKTLQSFVVGMDFDAYADDVKTQYACERAILNLSEAVRNFEKHGQRDDEDFTLASVSPAIEWPKIKGIGNVMRHDYENVANSQVWAVITDHLAELLQACEDALQAEEGGA